MTEHYDALLAAAAAADAAIASCHERVPCPRCGAEIGERCVRMLRSRPPVVAPGRRPVKHPHRDRWTQEVPAR